MVLEDFTMEAPKTREFYEIRKNLEIEGRKSLLVLPETNKNIYLSSRNLDHAKVTTISELNTYDIMDASVVVFVESSISILQASAS
jgi:large subunit ribosomal protein L4